MRNDEVFELIATIEEKLIKKKEAPINTNNIKEFDGNVLNW